MFEDFMNHRCNIYHLEDDTVNVGYGVKQRTVRKTGSIAATKEQPCHFHTKVGDTVRIVQNEPFSSVDGEIKLSLPAGVDIRMNDIVEDCSNGLRYRAGVPRAVHAGHHIIVGLNREGGTKAAI